MVWPVPPAGAAKIMRDVRGLFYFCVEICSWAETTQRFQTIKKNTSKASPAVWRFCGLLNDKIAVAASFASKNWKVEVGQRIYLDALIMTAPVVTKGHSS